MSAAPLPRTALPHGRLLRLAPAPTLREQRVLSVEFRSPDGSSWTAVGGGDTAAEAISWARESCPAGAGWEPVEWDDLYGD